MSHCQITHDFFQDGRLDVLAEIRALQACEQWTKGKRARWTKEAKVAYEQARRTHPLGSSYNAGRLAGLKSTITARYPKPQKEQVGKTVFCALPCGTIAFCKSCGDEATWECGYVGGDDLMMLCGRCKQERVREISAYITPSGWDWDEEMLPALPDPVWMRFQQMKKEVIALAPVFLPLATLTGFGLSNLLWPISHSMLFTQLVMVVLVRWQSTNIARLLFSLSCHMESENERF